MSQKWLHERMVALGVHPLHCEQHDEMRLKRRVFWPDEDLVAVLIDGDHNPASSMKRIQSVAEQLGPFPIQWVYGNWAASYLKAWQQLLVSHRLEARECDPVTPGKNTADIMLVVDAMELYAEGIRKFVLVASDSDYTPLVSRLCAKGCLVVVLGKATAPLALQEAASAFHRIDHPVVPDHLVPVYERSPAAHPVVLPQTGRVECFDAPSEKVTPVQPGDAPEQLHQWVLAQLMIYETAPYAWVEVPRFGHYLWTRCGFRSKAHSYKNITVLLKAFPKVFEVCSFQEKALLYKVRRVKA